MNERSDQLETGSARRIDLDAGVHRVAALAAGPADGPAVLLVPGFTGSKEDFGPLLDPLSDAGFRSLAIDLPGQYESAALPRAADYSPDRLGSLVTIVAAGLGGRVRLVGHSFGGLVARAAVIAAPSAFRSLVLLSSGPAQLDGTRRQRIEQLAPLLATGGMPAVLAAMRAVDSAQPGYRAPSPPLADFLARRFLASSPVMLQGMGDALRTEPDRVVELGATGVPILVLHGADDDAWPPAVQHEMARRLGASHTVVADAAHSAAVENPAATATALIDFWRAADQPRGE